MNIYATTTHTQHTQRTQFSSLIRFSVFVLQHTNSNRTTPPGKKRSHAFNVYRKTFTILHTIFNTHSYIIYISTIYCNLIQYIIDTHTVLIYIQIVFISSSPHKNIYQQHVEVQIRLHTSPNTPKNNTHRHEQTAPNKCHTYEHLKTHTHTLMVNYNGC